MQPILVVQKSGYKLVNSSCKQLTALADAKIWPLVRAKHWANIGPISQISPVVRGIDMIAACHVERGYTHKTAATAKGLMASI